MKAKTLLQQIIEEGKKKKQIHIKQWITKHLENSYTTFISSKASRLPRITPIENEAVISDDQKVAETLSKFFVKPIDKLDIK